MHPSSASDKLLKNRTPVTNPKVATPGPSKARSATRWPEVAKSDNDRPSLGREARTAHLDVCPSIKAWVGVKLWPPAEPTLPAGIVEYASRDMEADDWTGCRCGELLLYRNDLLGCVPQPSQKENLTGMKLVWVNSLAKPNRSWDVVQVTTRRSARKRKSWSARGTGQYRDVSNSPIVTGTRCDPPKKRRLTVKGQDQQTPTRTRQGDHIKRTPPSVDAKLDALARVGHPDIGARSYRRSQKRQIVFGDLIPTPIPSPDQNYISPDGDIGTGDPTLHTYQIHIGNKSITGHGVLPVLLEYVDAAPGQNTVRYLANNLEGWRENVSINDIGDVRIATRYSVTTTSTALRSHEIGAHGTRLVGPDVEIQPIVINFTGGKEILLTMHDSNAADFIRGETVDARRLSSSMNTGPYFPNRVVERMAPLMRSSRSKVNNAAFYALGWLAVHQLHTLETANIQYVYRAPVVGALTLRATDVGIEQQDALYNHFLADLGRQKIFLNGADFSAADLAFLARLASGFPLITSAAGQRRCVLQYVQSPQVYLTVYSNEVRQLPAIVAANWNSRNVNVLMRKVATLLGDEYAWLQGYMRSATIIRGIMTERQNAADPPVVTRRWVNALLEICGTAWPIPGGTNPMWRWAGVEPVYSTEPHITSEVVALGSMTSHDAVLASHILGQLISSMVTTCFILFNITTVELNTRFHGEAVHDQTEFLRTLMSPTTPYDTLPERCPVLVRAAANLIGDYTGMNVDWRMFSSTVWNNNDAPADPADVEISMWRLLAAGAPRISSVLCVGFLTDVLPDLWNMLGPPITMDVSDDLAQGADGRCWSAQQGDMLYHQRANSKTPYIMVPYGAVVLGALRQQVAAMPDWVVPMRELKTARRGKYALPGDLRAAPVPMEWVPVLNIAEPGTAVSYTYPDRVVLAPEMTEAVFGAALFAYMSDNKGMTLGNAGITISRVPVARDIEAGFQGLAVACKPKNRTPTTKAHEAKKGGDNEDEDPGN